MKYLLSLLIFIHGSIHLLGFLKAFKFADVSELTHDISRIPVYLTAEWELETGPWTWLQLRINNIEYNINAEEYHSIPARRGDRRFPGSATLCHRDRLVHRFPAGLLRLTYAFPRQPGCHHPDQCDRFPAGWIRKTQEYLHRPEYCTGGRLSAIVPIELGDGIPGI